MSDTAQSRRYWRSAGSLPEGSTRLSEHGVIEPWIADAMKRAVGPRNVVAHGYSGIDVASCYQAATTGLDDLERFATQVSRWATSRTT